MKISMFHNPKCSKSRETLQILNERGITPELILYLKTPPTEKELSEIVKKLGIAPQNLIRFKEPAASNLGLSLSDTRPEAEWLQLMAEHPILIERPIVMTDKKAVIGRPPEKVLVLFAPSS